MMVLKRIKDKLQNKGEESDSGKAKVEKKSSFQEKYETTMEAVTFAEAGAQDMAQEVVVRGQMERPKILVVGKEDTFSELVLEYAVSLAERLNHDLIAMNVNTVTGHSGKFLSPFKKHLREEFEKRSCEAFEPLKEKAQAKGIHCEHVVRFATLNKAVEELHHQIKRIEFVITEPEIDPDQPEAEVTIPVFSMQTF